MLDVHMDLLLQDAALEAEPYSFLWMLLGGACSKKRKKFIHRKDPFFTMFM